MPDFPMMPFGNSGVDVPARPAVEPAAVRRPGGPAVQLAVGLLLALSGCQCCCGTNVVSCVVDWGVDHAVPFDCVYCSCLDLTRINRPGGLQCCCGCGQCCPPVCCSPGQVYAHRWLSPPPLVAADPGLQPNPTYPAPEAGPGLPPRSMPPLEMRGDQVEPLFPMPQPAPALPSQVDPPPADPPAGVIQMRYLQPPTLPSPWHVPTDMLFGN